MTAKLVRHGSGERVTGNGAVCGQPPGAAGAASTGDGVCARQDYAQLQIILSLMQAEQWDAALLMPMQRLVRETCSRSHSCSSASAGRRLDAKTGMGGPASAQSSAALLLPAGAGRFEAALPRSVQCCVNPRAGREPAFWQSWKPHPSVCRARCAAASCRRPGASPSLRNRSAMTKRREPLTHL